MGGPASVARIGNLPADTTSFVGRKGDTAEVRRLLSVSRLVTLTGVGGVGKTRLAVRVASSLSRNFPDGAWLVELEHVREPTLVARTVSEALQVPDETGRDPIWVLCDYLHDRNLLLVLDNCEHLLAACRDLVAALLPAAPGLTVLATGRERLRLPDECVWHVAPLSLPDPGQPLPPGAAVRYPALMLFAERAAAAEPGFALTPANEARVAQVCRLLDGIPRASELGAVRLRALSLDHLLSRLADRYWSLAAGRRGQVPRHQTLAAAVAWSFNLCSAREQLLWARAAVFAGGFDLAAAEDVCAGDGLPADETALRSRHRDHYLAAAEEDEAHWFGARQPEICTRTRLEHANIRDALDFCLESAQERPVGLRMAATLWFYWAGCGMLGEGRHWLDRALFRNPQPGPERARALWVDGYVATLQGDLPSAVAMLEECRAYARRAGDDV